MKLEEAKKNRKLNDLLDVLQFNQVIIFVKSVQRAVALDKLLQECSFPSVAVHSGLKQDERINRYKLFKEFQKRILVATDLFGRGRRDMWGRLVEEGEVVMSGSCWVLMLGGRFLGCVEFRSGI